MYDMLAPDKNTSNLALLGRETKRWKDTSDMFLQLSIKHRLAPDVAVRAYFAEETISTVAENIRLGVCCNIVAIALNTEVLGVLVHSDLGNNQAAITLLAIDPLHMAGSPGNGQLRGVGTGLVAAASRQLLARGVTGVLIHPFDKAAASFWKGRGFIPCNDDTRLCITGRPAVERLIDGCTVRPEGGCDTVICGTPAFTIGARRPTHAFNVRASAIERRVCSVCGKEADHSAFECDLERDIKIGRASGYPECCIQYYIESKRNPDLPRWYSTKLRYLPCPSCAARVGNARKWYTHREACKVLNQPVMITS